MPPASTGLMESWEMPATFETRLVTWLLTCEATNDSACLICRSGGLFALASVVVPNASRLMMSAAGNEGSEE